MNQFILTLAILLIGCTSAPVNDGVLARAEKAIAGDRFISCGTVGSEEDSSSVDACVMKAYQNKVPFIARYEVASIDSHVILSLVGNDLGTVFEIQYDSNVCGGVDTTADCVDQIRSWPCSRLELEVQGDQSRIRCHSQTEQR